MTPTDHLQAPMSDDSKELLVAIVDAVEKAQNTAERQVICHSKPSDGLIVLSETDATDPPAEYTRLFLVHPDGTFCRWTLRGRQELSAKDN